MDPFSMVVAIVFMSLVTGTAHKYLDVRAGIAKSHGSSGDRSVLQAVEALRAEIAALRQREAEAILTFDTTLQNMDSRLKHLEQGALTVGSGARSPLSAGASLDTEEPVQVKAGQAA